MQTGGYKGRSREVDPEVLLDAITARLGVGGATDHQRVRSDRAQLTDVRDDTAGGHRRSAGTEAAVGPPLGSRDTGRPRHPSARPWGDGRYPSHRRHSKPRLRLLHPDSRSGATSRRRDRRARPGTRGASSRAALLPPTRPWWRSERRRFGGSHARSLRAGGRPRADLVEPRGARPVARRLGHHAHAGSAQSTRRAVGSNGTERPHDRVGDPYDPRHHSGGLDARIGADRKDGRRSKSASQRDVAGEPCGQCPRRLGARHRHPALVWHPGTRQGVFAGDGVPGAAPRRASLGRRDSWGRP